MENITIRSVKELDYEQIIALFREFASFENLSEKMLNSVERLNDEKAFFNCFVAETDDNRIIGYVSYFFCYYTWIGKSLYMDDLYVKLEYRSRGVGSRLLNRVIDFAKESNCHKLRWQVSAWNASAIEFYKRNGATIDAVEQNCDLLLD